MWAALLISFVSSMDIPIHYKEVEGIHEFPFMSLAKDSSVNPLYVGKSFEFFAKVSVGGQELNLGIDLVSVETRVALSQCQCTTKATVYNPSYSWYSYSVSGNNYDSSSEKYTLYKDTMSINTLSASEQLILAATKHSKYGEGLAGSVGFGNSQNLKDENYIRNLWEKGIISEPIFSITLENPLNPRHDSVLTIGKKNFWKYATGTKTTIKPDGYFGSWSTRVSTTSFDNHVASSRVISAVFAPSFGFLVIPPVEYAQLTKYIGSSGCFDFGVYTCSCDPRDLSRFPDLNLKIDGNTYTILAEDYVVYSSGYCYVAALNVGVDLYILGSPFFYNYYAVFDMKQSLITLAKADNFSLNESNESGYISYSTFGIIGVAGLGLFAWKIRKSKKANESSYEPMM